MFTVKFIGPIDLKKTFECGQYFLYKFNETNNSYYFTINGSPLRVTSISEDTISVYSTDESKGMQSKVRTFFRADDDYLTIIDKISSVDALMKKIVDYGKGLRLLKQEPFMCTISYLLSQMSNIPKITKNLESFCETFGETCEFEEFSLPAFPDRQKIKVKDAEIFRELKYGYRADYIYLLLEDYPSILKECERKSDGSQFDFPKDSDRINKELKKVHGIGQKVADCIQLFAFGDTSLFPVDTWMQKFMIKYYSDNKNASPVEMKYLGQKIFGEYAGYAQEFIFYYARNHPEEFKLDSDKPKKKKSSKKTDPH